MTSQQTLDGWANIKPTLVQPIVLTEIATLFFYLYSFICVTYVSTHLKLSLRQAFRYCMCFRLSVDRVFPSGNTLSISTYNNSCFFGLFAKLYKKNARAFPVYSTQIKKYKMMRYIVNVTKRN